MQKYLILIAILNDYNYIILNDYDWIIFCIFNKM